MDIKEKINNAPNKCGIYSLIDIDKNIIYIGKAVSIKKRLKTHFSSAQTGPKHKALIAATHDISYIPTSSPEAAFLLEAALIKRVSPKYNAALKDDKSYPVLKLTINEDFPRLFITRRKVNDGALYFGPYTNTKLLRKAFKLIGRLFPLRTCKSIPGKACLDFHIGRCLAPCINNITKADYRKISEKAILFLEGKTDKLKESLIKDMKASSEQGNFELAAHIRDQIKAICSVVAEKGYAKIKVCTFSSQLSDLAKQLNLPRPPRIIEAFDVSNTYGKQATGSMIVFKQGVPFKEGYRKFKIKTVIGIDDYSMIKEIVGRRYARLALEKEQFPDLIIIDGGKGHLMSVKKKMHELKIWQVPVISIAKSFEQIYISENKPPLAMDSASPASLLVQRIRDEAHRFAINYHRVLRRKKVSESELDNISGLGQAKKRVLIEYFGSVDEIKMAEFEDLIRVKYINEKQARKIYDYFNKSL